MLFFILSFLALKQVILCDRDGNCMIKENKYDNLDEGLILCYYKGDKQITLTY